MPNEKGLIPHLVCDGAAKAIDFYKAAFGAVEVFRMPYKDGSRLMHAQVTIDGATLMLADDFPEFHDGKSHSPLKLDGNAVTIHRNVTDCDASFKKAIAVGAKEKMAPIDKFWGDRYAQIIDPFGHVWSFATPLKK